MTSLPANLKFFFFFCSNGAVNGSHADLFQLFRIFLKGIIDLGLELCTWIAVIFTNIFPPDGDLENIPFALMPLLQVPVLLLFAVRRACCCLFEGFG